MKLDGSSSGHDRAKQELKRVVVPRLRQMMHAIIAELLALGQAAA